MVDEVVCVYKVVGETPLEAIHKLVERKPEFKDQKIAYAGRLDPMAEGLLVLLVGEATKRRSEYQDLEKEYEFEMMLGIKSDSYDLLGYLDKLQVNPTESINSEQVEEVMKSKIGVWYQKYPPYSSKAVFGKKMFEWAREGKLNEITPPKKEIKIYSIDKIAESKITTRQIQTYIENKIPQVKGLFRQEEILARWKDFFELNPKIQLPMYKYKIACGSGTYVRGLVYEVGNILGCGAITYTIKRTKVGKYTLHNIILPQNIE